MLMKGAQAAGVAKAGGAAGGLAEQFMQALGASGSPNQSNKQIGMQFANAGLQAPQIPTIPLMQNMNQQTIQRQAPQTFNPLIQMLLNGGR
jgi:hypothetical protein